MAVKWEKVHVFISSTFKDMHAERDYLVKRVFPQLSEWCEKRRLRLVDIDLRWGVTEQDAESKNTIKVCLDRIDDCRPFFVCFLGQRRGWVPPKEGISSGTFEEFPILKDKYAGETSATELEIIHALVDPLHRGKQRDPHKPGEFYEPARYAFFYLRDDSYLKDLPAEALELRKVFTNENVADDRELERWRKEKIPSLGRPVHAYSARWDPGMTTPELGLPGRLTDFQCQETPLEEIILEDLKQAISARYPDHVVTESLTGLQQEIDQQEQFLFSASEGFIAREDDFKDLDAYLNNNDNRPFLLTAPGGAGKTTLLANWIERQRKLIQTQRGSSIHFRFVGQSDRSNTTFSLLSFLLRELKEVSNKLVGEIPNEPTRLYQEFPKLLEAASKRGRTIIVLDALNQLETGLSNLSWLPTPLPNNVKMIVSFKIGDTVASELLQRMGSQAILAQVKPFSDLDDRRKLVNVFFARYLKDIDQRHLDAIIQSVGAENPLFLKVLLSELRIFGAFASLDEKIRSDFGESPISAFRGVLKRLEEDPAYSPIPSAQAVPLIFGLLAHARQGLSAEELASLLVQELGLPDNESSHKSAADCVFLYLRQVRPFLSFRDGCYDFFFESFNLAAQEEYAGEATTGRSEKDWHRMIATYLAGLPVHIDTGKQKIVNRRKLSDQAFHQTRAGMGDELVKTLTDCTYLQAKIVHIGVQMLIDDYQLSLDPNFVSCMPSDGQEAASTLLDFYRLSAHIFSYEPEQLVGQLNGRLAQYHNPRIQDLLSQARAECKSVWFHPITASLKTPGSAEEMTIQEQALMLAQPADGKRLITANAGQIKMFDLERGSEKYSVPNGMIPISMTPDGKYLIHATKSQALSVWNLETDRQERILGTHQYWQWTPMPADIKKNQRIRVAAQNRNHAVTASDQGVLELWNLHTGTSQILQQQREITALAITWDSKKAAAFLKEGVIQIWNLETLKIEQTIKAHLDDLATVGILPDITLMVGIFNDRICRIWQADSEKEFVLKGIPDAVDRIYISKDESFITFCIKATEKHTWNLLSGIKIPSGLPQGTVQNLVYPLFKAFSENEDHILKRRPAFPESGLVSPDGSLYVSRSSSNAVRVWDMETGEEKLVLSGFDNPVVAMAISHDEATLLLGFERGTITVFSLVDGKEKHRLVGHFGAIKAIIVSPDSTMAFSISNDRTIKCWSLSSGELIRTLSNGSLSISNLKFTPDGQHLVACSLEGPIQVWNPVTGVCELELKPSILKGGSHMDVTPDGKMLITDHRGTLIVWNLEKGTEERTIQAHSMWVTALEVSLDGSHVISSCGTISSDLSIKISKLASPVQHTVATKLQKSYIHSIKAIKGSSNALVSSGGQFIVYDLPSMKVINTIKGQGGAFPGSGIKEFMLTSDGQNLISCNNFTIFIQDHKDGRVLETIKVGSGDQATEITSMALMPDERQVIVGTYGGTISIWDLHTKARIEQIINQPNLIQRLAITPDGSYLIYRSDFRMNPTQNETRNIIFGLISGCVEKELKSDQGCFSLSPDGKFFAYSLHEGRDDLLAVFNLISGEQEADLKSLSGRIDEAVFTVDNRYLFTRGNANIDRPLRLWDFPGRRCLAAFYGDDRISACAYIPEQRLILAGDTLGDLHLLKVEGLEI